MILKRQLRGLAVLIIILFVLWQLWQRTHIVFFVNIPWWGAILLFVLLILVVEWLVERIIKD